MFLKDIVIISGLPQLVLPVLLVASINCGGGGGGSSGTAGSGGSAGHAGTTGGGGTGGSGGTSSTINCGIAAATAADMSILDFNAVPAGSSQATFGGYMMGSQYGGGTFIYPDATMTADAMGLSNSFDGMSWHITGLVKDYAGFGLYLTSTSDVSMFGGIQFDISGSFAAASDGGVPTAQATMNVGDVAHDVDSLHRQDGKMTCGTCAPTTSQYDGTCAAPTKVIPLTSSTVTQMVHWTDLTGGKRPPQFTGESPNPASITSVNWVLPWSGTGSAPYTVDITVDNIKYMAP